MDNLYLLTFPLFLLFVVAAQVWEKRTILERESRDKDALLEEIAKLQTALISRSGQEYAAARAMDTVIKEEKKEVSTDEVDATELSDAEYRKMIMMQNEAEDTQIEPEV